VPPALAVLILATLGLCGLTLLALWLTDPKEQAPIKAAFWLLVGVAFGALVALAVIQHLVN
jgi:hypothetical protein